MDDQSIDEKSDTPNQKTWKMEEKRYSALHQRKISSSTTAMVDKSIGSSRSCKLPTADMANDARQIMATTLNSSHGTSVAPRLRPKAAQQTSTTPSLGLTLSAIPLNQSPKNVISPIPGFTSECEKFEANFNDKFVGASMPRFSPNSVDGDSASLKLTIASNTVSPATLLSPFEQESMLTLPTKVMRSRPTALSYSQQQILSNSNSEKSLVSPLSGSFTCNPFGDPSPFSPISTLTEDQLFGAEFDKLRLEGSQTSIVTSPEEMKSDWSVSCWGESHQISLSQALSTGMIASNGATENVKELPPQEDDPFGSAPFTLPKRFKQKSSSSKLASKLSGRWRHAVGSGQGGKESLIDNTPTDNCGISVDKRSCGSAHTETLGLENSVLIGGGQKTLMLDDLISSGEKGSPSFIKLPLDDRNKYEKLNSNGITSDDSDSEFYPESVGSVVGPGGTMDNNVPQGIPGGVGSGVGVPKKHSFKHFVESNMPEKLQAVYHKVDKSQIKNVQIVKKLRSKVAAHAGKDSASSCTSSIENAKQRRKEKRRSQIDGMNASTKENASDDDSIGSASDLRANDEEIDPKVATNAAVRKRVPFNRASLGGEGSVDDAISESIKTCGSSAYHAECESVTTNEDNTSRIVTRVRVKKRERPDSKHSVIDENDSVEEDIIQGERPLLLDDELDYESAVENNNSGEEVLMDPFTPEEEIVSVKSKPHICLEDDPEADVELDPFAMAPFRKPFLTKRNSFTRFMPVVHPIPEHYPTGCAVGATDVSNSFITSTPLKPEPTSSSQCNDIFDISDDHLMPLPEPLATPPLRDKSPNICLYSFRPEQFPSASPASVGAIIEDPRQKALHSPPIQQRQTSLLNILGQSHNATFSVAALHDSSFSRLPTDKSSGKLTHIIPNNTSIAIPVSGPHAFPTISVSEEWINTNQQVLASTQQIHNQNMLAEREQLSARRSYINFSQIPAHSIACISPDNNYVNFHTNAGKDDDVRNLKTDDYEDNSSNTIPKISSKGFLTKKQKVKYNHLHEKSNISAVHNHGRDEIVATTKLGQKVKANVSGYRKVVSEVGGGVKSKKEELYSKPSKANCKSSSKAMGFSNMSFEDFPSDELADEPVAADGVCLTKRATGSERLLKMAPFEVIRNEKMLQEAEKKFGSLKRRSNPFS